MDLFELVAKIALGNKEFNESLDEAEDKGKKLGEFLGGMIAGVKDELDKPTLIAGVKKLSRAFMSAMDNTTEYADRVDKGAKRLEISTDMYQRLSYAIEASGGNMNNLRRGMTNLRAIMEGDTTSKAAKAFAKLNVSLESSNDTVQSAEGVFTETLYAIADIEDKAERADIAKTLFGTDALNAFLDEGSEGIKQLLEEAENLGLIMSNEDISQAVETRDAMNRLQKSFENIQREFMMPFLPIAETVADSMIPLLQSIKPLLQSFASGLSGLFGALAPFVGRVFGIGDTTGLSGHEISYKQRQVSRRISLIAIGSGIGHVVGGTVGSVAGAGIGLVVNETISTAEDIVNSAGNPGGGAPASVPGAAGGGQFLYIYDAEQSGTPWFGFGHAKGLWSVPYDNYPALLHRDEIVLDRTRADEYRDGDDASDQAVINAIQRVESALANIRFVVGDKELGRTSTGYGKQRINDYIGGYDNRLATGYGS